MLSVSSLRRIAHSTSLRATGSLMVFCRSSAWLARPRRVAETASLTAAISTDEVQSVEATANRGPGAAAWVLPVVTDFDVAAAFALVAFALAVALLSLEPALASFLAVSLEVVFEACLAASFVAVSFFAASLADGFAASLGCAPSGCGLGAG